MQTRLVVLLETGRDNCVSSVVLYLILARAIDLEIHGVVSAVHSSCRLPHWIDCVILFLTVRNRFSTDCGAPLPLPPIFGALYTAFEAKVCVTVDIVIGFELHIDYLVDVVQR